jgi:outer membrane protein, heavy metal efflux system
MKSKSLTLLLALVFQAAGVPPGLFADEQNNPERSPEKITLPQAIQRVLASNPEIAASELELQAASARILQAGLRSNPEFSLQVADVPALRSHDIWRTTETELSIAHKIETGGKRAQRVQAAGREKDLAALNLELVRIELLANTRLAFVDVLVNQQRLGNNRELTRLAHQSHSIVVERVAAGKASPIEQTRSVISLAAIELEEEKQARELIASKDKLASLWGGHTSDFEQVSAGFAISPIPERLDSCIERSPNLKHADAVVASRSAALALEQAMRKPDLTVSGGFKRSNPDSANEWVAGISIPLPLFDKRQGAVAEAQIHLKQASLNRQTAERNLRAGLAQARYAYDIAAYESAMLLKTTLPAASEVLASTEEGYRLGKLDYLNVLDAQRIYAELKRKHIDAIAAGMKEAIEIERLSGCNLKNISEKEMPDEK